MEAICEVSNEEKLKRIPVMLSEDALLYYLPFVKQSNTYEEASNPPLQWYNSAYKQSRILTKRQSMSFPEELSCNLNDSEVEVLPKLVVKLMYPQRQLDPSYLVIYFSETK